MERITEILGNLNDERPASAKVDHVHLSADERASPHLACVSDGGRRLRISLPRGQELQDGDILALDGAVAVVVAAAPEELFVIPLGHDPLAAAVTGYQLGNLHRPVRFLEDALLTPCDPMVADILDRLEVVYATERRPFVGRRYGAFSRHHHH